MTLSELIRKLGKIAETTDANTEVYIGTSTKNNPIDEVWLECYPEIKIIIIHEG